MWNNKLSGTIQLNLRLARGAKYIMRNNNFIKNVEKMINPIDVGTIHFIQSYSKILNPTLQYKMISSGAKKNPYMGFVVEPYSFFLCYVIKDIEWAEKLIPYNFKLVKTKIFEKDEPNYYCIFGSFNVHSSAFWGTRMEFYVIAENIETSLLSWVIIDYDTNTVSFDRKKGLSDGNTKTCILTTDYDGKIIIDIRNEINKRELIVNADISKGNQNGLSSRLWLEGNLSVAYGRDISKNEAETFSMVFSPKEVEKALEIPNDFVSIEKNTWYTGLYENSPTNIVCFPFAQHYLSDSPGYFSNIKNEQELNEKLNQVDFDSIPTYSSKPIKKAFKLGQIFSIIVIVVLFILLVFK